MTPVCTKYFSRNMEEICRKEEQERRSVLLPYCAWTSAHLTELYIISCEIKLRATQLHVICIACVLYCMSLMLSRQLHSTESSDLFCEPQKQLDVCCLPDPLIHLYIFLHGKGCSPHGCWVSALHIADLQVCF